MGFQFSDEDKQVKEFAERIPFGVTKIQITGALADEMEDGRAYLDVGVVDPSGIEEEVRLWFTGGATNISFNTLRQIVVHNAKTDEAKEKARGAVDGVKELQELADIINEHCVGGEAWFTKFYDAKGRIYQGQDGKWYKSVNKNIHGYEPKERPDLMPQDQQPVKAEDFAADDDINQIVPGGVPASDADKAKIPDNWS